MQHFVLTGILFVLLANMDFSFARDCFSRTFHIVENREIRLFNEKKTYEEAKLQCKLWGDLWRSDDTGRLASIRNVEDQQCIQEMISLPSNYNPAHWDRLNVYEPGYYIGATDLDSEGQWVWQGLNMSVSYSNWAYSEPNDVGNFGEDCVQLMLANTTFRDYHLGKWIDVPCTSRKFYICERELLPSLIWGYDNNEHATPPSRWNQIYPVCAGSRQSPINVPSNFNCNNKTTGGIKAWKSKPHSTWIIENTGRFIKIRPKQPQSTWTVFKQNHRLKFYVDYMILKIGDGVTLGSDHSNDGVRFDGELQVFHESHAPGKRHALAFMIEKDKYQPNTYWYDLLIHVHRAQKPGLESEMSAPRDGLRPFLRDSFPAPGTKSHTWRLSAPIRYLGSLPHPPCTEDIIWTVVFRPMRLSIPQFEDLRRIEMEGRARMHNNFRPLQTQTNPNFSCNITP